MRRGKEVNQCVKLSKRVSGMMENGLKERGRIKGGAFEVQK